MQWKDGATAQRSEKEYAIQDDFLSRFGLHCFIVPGKRRKSDGSSSLCGVEELCSLERGGDGFHVREQG